MEASYSGQNRSMKYLFDHATEVSAAQIETSGTPIATITVDGTDVTLYSPAGTGTVKDVLVDGVSVVDQNGDAQLDSSDFGTPVEANPSDAATDDLNTIKIGDTVYDILGGGGCNNYGKFTCDVLFENTDGALPELSSTLFATLSKSISDYDALFIETSLYYNDDFHQAKPLIIFKQDYNFANSDGLQLVQDFSAGSSDYRLFIRLYDETHIYANRTTNSGGGASAMTIAKVYGLKFENKLINRSDIYSEEEREVGVWTDAKPLYQKTVTVSQNTSTNNSSWTNVPCGTIPSNIEAIRKFDIIIRSTSQEQLMLNAHPLFRFRFDGTDIQAASTNNGTLGSGTKITIQYTKTTDQPGSGTCTPEGQLAHHYSTSEKIVGTWIDGSTLYERTWDFGSNVTFPSNTWTNTNIDASNISKIINVQTSNTGGDCFSFEARCASTYIQLNHWRGNNSGIDIRYLTLQYTKTSS